MLGCVIGDIVGSIYEFANIKSKDFQFFGNGVEYTDDSILAIATADWILNCGDVASYYAKYTELYPDPMGGYGTSFKVWAIRYARTGYAEAYNSCGNGSAMRICPVGWTFDDIEDVLKYSKLSAECTHNHPEGIKGAQATAASILLARQGASKKEIESFVIKRFGYDLSMSVQELQKRYSWQGIDGEGNGGLCQESVPQAMICALQATDFEDAVRNAISIGGDSDTIGCIAGGIAEALYGIPQNIYDKGLSYLPNDLKNLILKFEEKYGCNIIAGQ